ncbi:unnamed protein product [Cuscuta campestris]|uniref:Pectinesterase n=1 Tax=Cuscuta campestris TaxID=132261 RepID=A0A484NFU9_9ASTE|nr:unnamed protein product [Cuscuta campestris]
MNSVNGYGKVDPATEQQAPRKKKTCKWIICIVVSAVLLGVIIGLVAGIVTHNNNKKKSDDSGDAPPGGEAPSSPAAAAAAVKALCSVTSHKDSCVSSLSQVAGSGATDPKKLFAVSLKVAGDSLTKLSSRPSEWKTGVHDEGVKNAFSVCEDVFHDAVGRLDDSVTSADGGDDKKNLFSASTVADLKTWLSSSITDQETCLDALDEIKANASIVGKVKSAMKDSAEFSSNSLAIVTHILSILGDFKIPIHRKLLTQKKQSTGGFPEWVRPTERRLLRDDKPTPDVIVDQNGSPGSVPTIGEAVKMVPEKNKTRFVIYVKAGEYVEKVELDKTKWNVMMYGDGKNQTVISGSANFIDGTPTFHTATFVVAGRGFMARDITFKNTAGPEKHQAVAMRSGSDKSVFYRCGFDAFQDTLYAHSNRQFYRECDIIGTIDFIFGNAAVVFQNCRIQPRQPLPNQFNTITAQGKKDPNENTGISIQKCQISPYDNVTAATYLGRPWKNCSTTVIMQSNIGAVVSPKGWIEWIQGVEPPSTIDYGEYMNTGPGAELSQRVKWAGYQPNLSPAQASKYTVGSFLEVKESAWLPVELDHDTSL